MSAWQTMAVMLSLTGLLSPFLERGSREVRQGLQDYHHQDWVGAIEHFQKAGQSGDEPVADYNLGAAAYQGENYPKALSAFEAATRSPDVPPARASYNLGNAKYRSGDLPGALAAYREALRQDPSDQDARWNYEQTLRQLQGGQQKQQDQKQQQQKGGDKQQQGDRNRSQARNDSTGTSSSSPGGEKQQSPPDSTGQEPQPRQAKPDSSGNQPQPASRDSTGTPPSGQGQAARAGRRLTPEEARQLLNAVTPEERELLRARLKPAKRRHAEKDW